jgi:hypothetical protein
MLPSLPLCLSFLEMKQEFPAVKRQKTEGAASLIVPVVQIMPQSRDLP